MRRWMVGAAAIAAGLVMVGPADGALAAAQDMGTWRLELDRPVFVDGPRDVDGAPLGPEPTVNETACDAGLTTCFDFGLDVVREGRRLRGAADWPADTNALDGETFGVQLIDPTGEVAARSAFSGQSVEAVVTDPAPGHWVLRVITSRARHGTFRIRALLEDDHPAGRRPRGDLLPNLRMTPPWEFTLATPTSPVGLGLDTDLGAGLAPTNGCLAVEMAYERPPQRCLRFSAGPENVGAGPFDLRFRPTADPQTGTGLQRIHNADGGFRDEERGSYEYHLAHTHYHLQAFSDYELFRVLDIGRGSMQFVGEGGGKRGYCTIDFRLAVWRSFANDADESLQQNCLGAGDAPVSEAVIGVARGWGDIYNYAVEGQFVDLGLHGDGLYVVRTAANHNGAYLEEDLDDNRSYALLEISGSTVRVLERGYGDSPWDRAKQVADDRLPPLASDP